MNYGNDKQEEFLKSEFKSGFSYESDLSESFTDEVMKAIDVKLYQKKQIRRKLIMITGVITGLIVATLLSVFVIYDASLLREWLPGLIAKYNWLPAAIGILIYIHICRIFIFLVIFVLKNKNLNFSLISN